MPYVVAGSWWLGLVALLASIAFWVALVLVFVALFRLCFGPRDRAPRRTAWDEPGVDPWGRPGPGAAGSGVPRWPSADDPERALARRFADGQIGEDEFFGRLDELRARRAYEHAVVHGWAPGAGAVPNPGAARWPSHASGPGASGGGAPGGGDGGRSGSSEESW
jgi:uncharacterized membrane protein